MSYLFHHDTNTSQNLLKEGRVCLSYSSRGYSHCAKYKLVIVSTIRKQRLMNSGA